jgi:hypothetical protein
MAEIVAEYNGEAPRGWSQSTPKAEADRIRKYIPDNAENG